MKSQIKFSVIITVLCLIVFPVEVAVAVPIGTAFTYQGRLMDANEPADGLYDFQFRLYDDPNVGGQRGSTVDINDLDIIDGYFTVELDFGSDVFDGNSVWLQISVRPDDSNDVYTILTPRQEVTPTPYAIYAKTTGGDNDWTVSDSDMYSIPSGKVGIGTKTPSEKLDIIGNTHISGQAAVGTTVDSFRALNVYRYQAYNPAYGGYFNAQGHEVSGTAYGIYADASADDENAYGIYATASSTWATPYAGYFEEGDVVVADGDVGIGTTDPKARLHVSRGSILLENSYGLFIMDNSFFLRRLLTLNDMNNVVLSNSAGGNIFLATHTSPGSTLVRMTVMPAGNVGIGTTNPSSKLEVDGGCITGSMCSDIRLKKNIIPLSSNDSILDRVMGLQAVTFEWKHRDDGKRQIGLIAQEVEDVFPEVVTTPDDGSCQKGLLTTGLDAVLVEAIKELRDQVEQLREQNEYLLQKLTALEVSK